MISHDTAQNPYFLSGKNGRKNHFVNVLGMVGTTSWQCTRWVPIIRNTLGSGVTNINKYLPYYAKGAKPRFEETRHGFELTIPLVEEVTEQVTEQARGEVTGEVAGEAGARVEAHEAQVEAQVGAQVEDQVQGPSAQPFAGKRYAGNDDPGQATQQQAKMPSHGQRQTDAGGRGMRNFNREIREWGRMSQTLESPLCILLDILGPEARVSNSIPAKPLPSMLNCGGFFFYGGNCP